MIAYHEAVPRGEDLIVQVGLRSFPPSGHEGGAGSVQGGLRFLSGAHHLTMTFVSRRQRGVVLMSRRHDDYWHRPTARIKMYSSSPHPAHTTRNNRHNPRSLREKYVATRPKRAKKKKKKQKGGKTRTTAVNNETPRDRHTTAVAALAARVVQVH